MSGFIISMLSNPLSTWPFFYVKSATWNCVCVNVCACVCCADEMSESRQTHVTLHDIDPQALEQLVQYAYTAEIVVGEGNVQVQLKGVWYDRNIIAWYTWKHFHNKKYPSCKSGQYDMISVLWYTVGFKSETMLEIWDIFLFQIGNKQVFFFFFF